MTIMTNINEFKFYIGYLMEGRKMIHAGQEKIFIKIIKVKISNGQGYWWVWGGLCMPYLQADHSLLHVIICNHSTEV